MTSHGLLLRLLLILLLTTVVVGSWRVLASSGVGKQMHFWSVVTSLTVVRAGLGIGGWSGIYA
jgi:hypothetical protein